MSAGLRPEILLLSYRHAASTRSDVRNRESAGDGYAYVFVSNGHPKLVDVYMMM